MVGAKANSSIIDCSALVKKEEAEASISEVSNKVARVQWQSWQRRGGLDGCSYAGLTWSIKVRAALISLSLMCRREVCVDVLLFGCIWGRLLDVEQVDSPSFFRSHLVCAIYTNSQSIT
jgi:hypothetical protein